MLLMVQNSYLLFFRRHSQYFYQAHLLMAKVENVLLSVAGLEVVVPLYLFVTDLMNYPLTAGLVEEDCLKKYRFGRLFVYCEKLVQVGWLFVYLEGLKED